MVTGSPTAPPSSEVGGEEGAEARSPAQAHRAGKGSAGAEMRQPLGLVMVGGLLVSQVLTLFTTPAIYLFFDRLGRAWRTEPRPLAVEEARA